MFNSLFCGRRGNGLYILKCELLWFDFYAKYQYFSAYSLCQFVEFLEYDCRNKHLLLLSLDVFYFGKAVVLRYITDSFELEVGMKSNLKSNLIL